MKHKKLYVYWYQLTSNRSNFGDELGPYIIAKLSGLKICYFLPTKKNLVKKLLLSMIYPKSIYKIGELMNILFGKRQVFLSTGSVLSHYTLNNCRIWGSGIIQKNSFIHNSKFYAVRGKYSQARLKELGYTAPEVIGDPALLLPIIRPVKSNKKYNLGIIPHYLHYHDTSKMIDHKEIIIINMLDSIETVISQINSCDCTCSSSLHGIIVSHAYKIPCLWFNLYGELLYGDNIKFFDYFSSVGIREYEPFSLPGGSELHEIINKISSTIKSQSSLNSIQNDLTSIQASLLKAAPFPLKKHYELTHFVTNV